MTTYRRSYSRSEIAQGALKSFIHHGVAWFSNRHLKANRRQLVSFTFDQVGTELDLSGVYELEQLDILFAWIRNEAPGVLHGTAVDVGANIGNHSLYFSDCFPRVFGFEITPRTYRVLQINSELVQNVTCFNVGLSNQVGEVHLAENARNMGGTRIVPSREEATLTVKVAALDSFADQIGPVSLLKIDVEGHELQVLQGAQKTIGVHAPLILFEQEERDFQGGSSPCVDLLRSMGYRVFLTIEVEHSPPFQLRNLRTDMLGWAYRAIFGHSVSLRAKQTFAPAHYPFIVAVPPKFEAAAARV